MGLDLLEFTVAVEEAFAFRFPDRDMPAITTPRRLIDYLTAHLPAGTEPGCLSQRAFYRLRSAVTAHSGCPRASLRSDTSLLPLIPAAARSEVGTECARKSALRTRGTGRGWPSRVGWIFF